MCLQRRVLNQKESSYDPAVQLDYDKLDIEFDDACDYLDIDGSADVICTDLDFKIMFFNIRGLIGKRHIYSTTV